MKGRKASKRETNLAEILVVNGDSLNQRNTIQTYRNTDSRYIRRWDQQDSVLVVQPARERRRKELAYTQKGVQK